MNVTTTDFFHGPGNSRNSEGSFVTLRDGRILFAYTRYTEGTGQDDDTADIAGVISFDSGATWSTQPRLLVGREEARNVMSVSLLRLIDGRLLMIYLRKNSTVDDCCPYARVSDDDGNTWSAPVRMISTLGYYVVNNDRVVQLQSGRLLTPVAQHLVLKKADEPGGRHFDMRGLFFVVFSDDAGVTWHEGPERWTLPSGRDFLQEPGSIELMDGRIWTWLRTNTGCQWQMFSEDGGNSWTLPEPSSFRSPISPLSMKRLPNGDLLAVWNDLASADELWGAAAKDLAVSRKSWGRTPLAAAVSNDDGKTWSRPRILEQDPERGYCYIAIHFTEDSVLLAYCCGGGESGHVLQDMRIRRVPLAWFYA